MDKNDNNSSVVNRKSVRTIFRGFFTICTFFKKTYLIFMFSNIKGKLKKTINIFKKFNTKKEIF